MKSRTIVISLTGLLALTGISSLLQGRAAPSTLPSLGQARGVRAEFEHLYGNNAHTESICYVKNTSLTQDITLMRVIVLGPGGASDIIAFDTATSGTVVPPLGELRIFIDDSIPGVEPQTTEEGHGVRSVVIEWSGAHDAMYLSAIINRHAYNGNHGDRETLVIHSYDITG